MRLPFAALRHPLVIAHRGSMVLGPENTIYSFELAVSAGADVLELDVHPSADARIMVIHDATVDRTSNGSGEVSSHTLKELRALDFGWHFRLPDSAGYPVRGRGVTIPTLDELFERFPDRHFSIDVKEDDLDFASSVVRLVMKRDLRDQVVLASFHPRIAALLRDSVPRPQVAADRGQTLRLLAASIVGLSALAGRPADAYLLPDRLGALPVSTRSLMRSVHALDRRIYVWTVDDPALMRRLLERGADGIITNRTDLAFAVRGELQGAAG